jgi:hypothetical protein
LFIGQSSCKKVDKKWSELPEVTNLDQLKQTEFVTTLESPINSNNNIIYAPALLYAWQEVKQELKSDILVTPSNAADFKILTTSTSWLNTLKDDEYSVDVDIAGETIIARAFFNKTLPFANKLQQANAPILFGKNKISAFGMYNYDKEIINQSQVLYYKDDDHFLLKLVPRDAQHEIILAKGLDKANTLAETVQQVMHLVTQGLKERADNKQYWKYRIDYVDMFSIPAIKFNIETNYQSLQGQSFATKNNNKYTIETAYQRTGFILNENGAVMESEAYVLSDTIATAPESHPKKMVFDKPFYVLLKRTGKSNPYFVMKVNNAELLVKEQ